METGQNWNLADSLVKITLSLMGNMIITKVTNGYKSLMPETCNAPDEPTPYSEWEQSIAY